MGKASGGTKEIYHLWINFTTLLLFMDGAEHYDYKIDFGERISEKKTT